MDEPDDDPCLAALERLASTLVPLFGAYRVPPEQQREIVDEAHRIFLAKWPKLREPDAWLLRRIVDRCRMLREEGDVEETPE